MSKSFINRSRNQNTRSNHSNELQKKIDPQARLDWINNQKVDQGFGVFNNDLFSGSAKAKKKSNSKKHTIVEGDTYWDIAKNGNGLFTVEDLKRWNPDIDWKNLQIGDQINISPSQGFKSFKEVSEDIRVNGFDIFMQYIEDEDYGVDYFICNCRKIEFERSGWLAKVIEMSPPTKDAFHIVAWRDSMISDGTPEVNALEHKIGTFLIGAKYGEEMAELIPAMNEIRGLIINDRQNGLMLEALNGSDNTAFTWSDIEHNKEGLKIYKEWYKKEEAERISKIKRFSKEWWLEIAKRMPVD